LQALLGYLNFSTGRPDPRAQAQLFAAWPRHGQETMPQHGQETMPQHEQPWLALYDRLRQTTTGLHDAGHAAFRDVQQVRTVLDLALRELPPAYRAHHVDLLFHQTDTTLFQPGFIVRTLEAVLTQQGPWDERDRIVAGALKQLNDYVGHRPVAILESRPRGEPYDHEKLAPVPLYLRGAGVAPGPYAALVARALELLRGTDPGLWREACFDFDRLDELAFDPRAYDHNHPADRRPNYRFGEWDPHHIDGHGFFRRLVVRQVILDGLLARVRQPNAGVGSPDSIPLGDLMHEAAVVLAATILMASGISGAGPDTHDSSVNLATLMPRVARYRDQFYGQQLRAIGGAHGARLTQEAGALRQPFGGARQHLNHFLAQQRAAQLQQRHLALLLAQLGYPEAARRHAARVPAASLRLTTEIHIHLTTCQIAGEHGRHAEAADHLDAAEATLRRAIACGATVDPWNVLGFQGLFPLFTATEDTVRDHRIEELVETVDRILTLYTYLRSETAAAGDAALGLRLATNMKRLAEWWDRFATTTVNDIHHVQGREAAVAADHLAETLAQWRQRGEATADLSFWRQHTDGFRTAKSFALVVDALLRKRDYRAAMALLMTWLSNVGTWSGDQAPALALEDGDHSFHTLALRWMAELGQHAEPAVAEQLAAKFIDYLEANAEEYWQVPRLERAAGEEELPVAEEVEDDALYGAAYEGVTYRDSTDDGVEGEVLGFEPQQEFELEHQAERLEGRLHFISTLARLFQLGSRTLTHGPGRSATGPAREVLQSWLVRARQNYQDLLALMDAIHEHPIPAPTGAHDSLVEFDRRNYIKQRLLTAVIGTCVEAALVVGSLQGVVHGPGHPAGGEGKRPRWEPALVRIEQALWKGDAEAVRAALPKFLEHFQHEPLMFTPLAQGGAPRLILRVAIAQALLRALAANLPRLGLLQETYGLLRIAQTMEKEQKIKGPHLTEFGRLFEIACRAVLEAAVESVKADSSMTEKERVTLVAVLLKPFVVLWAEHNRGVQMSVLEHVVADDAWAALREFLRTYGGDLFHARFMTLGNLRGIAQRGVGAWLKYLEENPDPQHPISLIDDLDKKIPRATAIRHLELVLWAVVDNYEEYKDYNTTTPQSDYGENLYTLLDFLRLKAIYDRQAWLNRPLLLMHEVLVRQRREGAVVWQEEIERLTAAMAAQLVDRLAELEKEHGMRLRTVGDRVRERFVLPLALDRVCALLEPAYEEPRHGGEGTVLPKLEAALEPYLAAPTGAGLDVPFWLRKMEGELERIIMRRSALANLAENLLQVPQVALPVEELRRQLEEWPTP
jgi:hypothetical protein